MERPILSSPVILLLASSETCFVEVWQRPILLPLYSVRGYPVPQKQYAHDFGNGAR